MYGYFVSPEYLAMNEMMIPTGYPEHARLVYMSFTHLSYYALLLVYPIFGIGIGAILGLVFVRVQRRIPFSTVTRKALLFAFVVSLISCATNLWLLVDNRTVFVAFLQFIITSCLVSLIVNLAVGGLAFSYLLTKR